MIIKNIAKCQNHDSRLQIRLLTKESCSERTETMANLALFHLGEVKQSLTLKHQMHLVCKHQK